MYQFNLLTSFLTNFFYPIPGWLADKGSLALLCVLVISIGIAPSTYAQTVGGMSLAGSDWDQRASHGAGITGRQAFASVVFDSDNDGQAEMWVFGGALGDGTSLATNRAEFSSTGRDWQTPELEPAWSPRSHFSAVVYAGKVWVFSGRGSAASDVWYSSDCVNWTQAANAPWSQREGYEVQVFGGKIWLMGGHDGSECLNDVWSFDGTTWIQEDDAPWSGRDGFSSAVLGGEMYVMGGRGDDGNSAGVLADVWKTNDGNNWTEVTSTMPLGPRREHSTVVFDDRIWIIGGNVSLVDDDYHPTDPTSKMDDVWYSSNGLDWTEASAYGDAPWHRSMSHESLVFSPEPAVDTHSEYQEFPRIFILGGMTQTSLERNTVWADRRDHETVSHDFDATDLPLTIESPVGSEKKRITESTITISDLDLLVTDITLSFDVTHQNWNDLRMRLVHFYTDENGVEQEIRGQFIAPGYGMLSGSGRVDVMLEDDLNTTWLDGSVPLINAVRFPNTYWEPFYGKPANGRWILWVKDMKSGDDGIIEEFSLNLRGLPLAGEAGGTETYESLDTPLSIPDNNPNGRSSDILVDDHLISSMTVNLDISHRRSSDLEVYLYGPNPNDPPIQLYNYSGENVVTEFIGTQSLGLWTIKVVDTRRRRRGTLRSWSITMDY